LDGVFGHPILANREPSDVNQPAAVAMARFPSSRTGDQGYTLIELLVVLTIMGLMVALAPPVLKVTRTNIQARQMALALASQLEAARQQALDTGTVIRLSLAGGKLAVFFPDGSAVPLEIQISKYTVLVSPISGRVLVNG